MAARASKKVASQLYIEPRLPERWDRAVIILTIVSLVLVAVEALADLHRIARIVLQWIDNVVCLIFVIDFGVRMKRATRKLEFFRRNWIDLLPDGIVRKRPYLCVYHAWTSKMNPAVRSIILPAVTLSP